jgi:carbamoyl-phosphate synthase large subunit
MMGQVKVLIAGAGGGGYGLEVLKALRYSERGHVIHVADMSVASLGMYLADQNFTVPSAVSPSFLKVLLDICDSEEIRVLIPGSDAVLKVVSQGREQLERNNIFVPINTREVIETGFDKVKTMETLHRCGFHTPRTMVIKAPEDIGKIDILPAVIKPFLNSGGSNFTFVAQDREELVFFCHYLLKYGYFPMVQEYIPAEDGEFTVGVLSDQTGKIISTACMRRCLDGALFRKFSVPSVSKKGRNSLISSGVSQGEFVDDPVVLEEAVRVARALDSRGPLNIQGRRLAGIFYIFEINPRFSGTTYFRALAGVNEPDLLIRKYVLGDNLPEGIYAAPGRAMRGLYEKFVPAASSNRSEGKGK